MCLAVTIFCCTRLNFNRTFCRSKFLHLLSLLRLNVLLLVWHLEEHNMAVEYSTPVILQKVSLEIFEDIA